ncbi:MAG: hypothetical protein KA109_03820 [Saprospiraceae bacterium]|jgi:hypothetical protein|nr:hypothetical protein [Saprospiraceae bacterium]MBK6817208.1 hypothetical protein [Saprospiraceae bacterium]MBK7435761.1 hypothetical protein [Saprospiraceae bacterium]MBK7606416.1 hypothetical protein [Saprospiraceae bacterium]MBK8281814.1 hypothetical protein [Saprospiraceae bacterium]
MDRTNHAYAMRFYSGSCAIDQINTRLGKTFKLLSLPYFLVDCIEEYLGWFVKY